MDSRDPLLMIEFCLHHPDVGFWMSGILLLGFISAWCARLAEGSRHQRCCHRVFLACMAVVGVCTVGALLVGPGLGMASGATFTFMVLAATWDPGANRRELGLGR